MSFNQHIYDVALEALKVGAPGISEPIKSGIARNIALKLTPMHDALQLATNIIMSTEPGDSRAVSDVAVAIAAASVGDTSTEVVKVIQGALRS
jgi:hypothetical protein